MPVIISNCSNNYGPYHFPEKLIPLFINNIIQKKPFPVYGDGKYTRDWLYVKDHARAIDTVFHKGKIFDTYNIGGFNEWKNIDVVKLLCKLMDEKLGKQPGESEKLITYVKDRPVMIDGMRLMQLSSIKNSDGNHLLLLKKDLLKPLTGICKTRMVKTCYFRRISKVLRLNIQFLIHERNYSCRWIRHKIVSNYESNFKTADAHL